MKKHWREQGQAQEHGQRRPRPARTSASARAVCGGARSRRPTTGARCYRLATYRPQDSSRRASRQLVDENQIVERIAALGRGAAVPENGRATNSRASDAISESARCGRGPGCSWLRLQVAVNSRARHSLLGPGCGIANRMARQKKGQKGGGEHHDAGELPSAAARPAAR